MVNKDFIQRKIELIQVELSRLTEFRDFSFQEVVKDYKTQAIVERLLERIIARAIDINQHLIAELAIENTESPKDYKETFLRLSEFEIYPESFGKSIAKSVGTRNVLIHEYNKVDYSQIYSSIFDCLEDYHRYCEYILKFIEKI